ncbi:MAG: aminopeptidase P family protein [Candidatus Omnitrophica bacterium]|nr:aminopeptidase P family protein [Candidatus Omnitrophota bacterium]
MKNRINRLIKILKKKDLDACFSSNQANIRYLTGIKEIEGWLLFTKAKELFFFTSPIYAKTINNLSNLKLIVIKSDLIKTLLKEAKKLKLKKIGFSGKDLTFNLYQKLSTNLAKEQIELLPTNLLIENLRIQKDKKELNLIKKATSVSLEAFDYIEEISRQNMTEKDLSIEIERFLKIKSDNKIAFPAIVASGKNTVFPHHKPEAVAINDFFLSDLGAMHCGYCSDLTRIFFWGKMPSLFQKIYDTIKKAQDAAIKKIRPGRKASDVDKAARDIIDKSGFGKYFIHGLGHGVGLEVHEPPYLKPGSNAILKENMVVTIEPGIYYKNQLGVRIEDMAIVKPNKCEVIS